MSRYSETSRTRTTRVVARLAMFSACMALSASGSAALVTNGSFESGLTGWTVSANGVDLLSAPTWQAASGTNSIDLNAFLPSSISQTLSTVIGGSYLLEFALGGNFSTLGGNRTVNLSVDSATTAYSVTRPSGWTTGNIQWSTISYFFLASAPTTVLSFSSTSPAAEGVMLDNISVTELAPVPLPGALALFGAGLAMLGFTRRRRA